MKKNFMFVCIALLVAMTLIVSCDNSNKKPAEEAQPTPTKEFTVTFDPNFEGESVLKVWETKIKINLNKAPKNTLK